MTEELLLAAPGTTHDMAVVELGLIRQPNRGLDTLVLIDSQEDSSLLWGFRRSRPL